MVTPDSGVTGVTNLSHWFDGHYDQNDDSGHHGHADDDNGGNNGDKDNAITITMQRNATIQRNASGRQRVLLDRML